MFKAHDPNSALIAAIEDEIVRLEQSKFLIEANLSEEQKTDMPDRYKHEPEDRKLCRQYGTERKKT
jgi:hypothetical protein